MTDVANELENDDLFLRRLEKSVEMAKAKRRAEGNITNDKNAALSEVQTIFENDVADKQDMIEAFEEIVEACQQNVKQLASEIYAASVRESDDGT